MFYFNLNINRTVHHIIIYNYSNKQEQREAIGTIIYHEIKQMGHPEDVCINQPCDSKYFLLLKITKQRAGKITGMLLAGSASGCPDIAELLNLLEYVVFYTELNNSIYFFFTKKKKKHLKKTDHYRILKPLSVMH